MLRIVRYASDNKRRRSACLRIRLRAYTRGWPAGGVRMLTHGGSVPISAACLCPRMAYVGSACLRMAVQIDVEPPCVSMRTGNRFLRGGQGEMENGAFILHRFDPDAASVGFDDSPADGEADACAGDFAAVQ